METSSELKEVQKQIEHRLKIYREVIRYLPSDEGGINHLLKTVEGMATKELGEYVNKLIQIDEKQVWRGY